MNATGERKRKLIMVSTRGKRKVQPLKAMPVISENLFPLDYAKYTPQNRRQNWYSLKIIYQGILY